MKYYSLNNRSQKVTFREATIKGQAPDRGLYFPENIPAYSKKMLDQIESLTKEEIAYEVIRPYVGEEIPEDKLLQVVQETIPFDFPLIGVTPDIYSLELYHGPTLAFKDVGARFMSRCLGYFVQSSSSPVKVLVATSGDTGGAVASGFYDLDGVDVIILYPSGKVSKVQELQLTTFGKNITALEIDGSFDECQDMVKQAFADPDLTNSLFLTSANSINVARWLPQQFYYLFAYKQWPDKAHLPAISVPSGNFGNICAGLLAHRAGLPFSHFIAACNANDIFPEYLRTSHYKPKKAVATISNAMDVGNPSNFVRVLELFDQHFISLSQVLSSFSYSDAQTVAILKDIYLYRNYLMDPHGAVGYLALEEWQKLNPGIRGMFLETAHPVKFFDVVEPIIGQKIPMPKAIQDLMQKEQKRIRMKADYEELKSFLMAQS